MILTVVISAAAEELLPVFSGAGFPMLLAAVLALSTRFKVLPVVMLAIGAGAFEDALSGLRLMTSVSFFVVAALLARKTLFPRPFLVVLFPAYGLWVGMCNAGAMGDLFVRLLLLLPLGAVAYAGLSLLVGWAAWKAGVDE